jgi:hypothetical protein
MARPWGLDLRGRFCRWSLVILAMAAFDAAPAAAQLPQTDQPLPGSSFQGADGDQDDGAGFHDWQFLLDEDRVRHSPDPNDNDSAFVGGTKEFAPGEWDLTTASGGVTPGSTNIRDAWSAVGQPGSDTFLYLAFTREVNQGTTFVTFELNRDDRLWDNGHALIPCRRTGDVQISYELQGNRPTIVVRRWTTTATDAATGCATSGELDDFTDLTPNEEAQGAINGAPIPSRLPGAYEGTVPTQRFGEASVNLARILNEAFHDECLAYGSVWMYSRSSNEPSSNMKDYVTLRALTVRTCSASGTKFFDSNTNGVRDDGEPGIPRFLIWADYDNDGIHDDNEPFSVSDDQGQYVIFDIHGTYTLREKLLTRRSRTVAVAADWVCSHPTTTAPGGRFPCAWGPIDSATEPNATGRDFGNWFPARLTLKKRLSPPTDPGRFDLLVNGNVKLAGAGNGERTTFSVPPGRYDVSEVAVPPTNPADYRSLVRCRRFASRRGGQRSGTVYEDLVLVAGMDASCTFYNIRPPSPAIAIRKIGPDRATAGDRLDYRLEVTNLGDVAFPASTVVVSDPNCDPKPPELDSKGGDPTLGTLDPGDMWTYVCSHRTTDGANCEPTRFDNTATVTGTAGGTTVSDDDSISTIILCPDQPPPPTPKPGPGPGPVVPPGPRPPNAGDAAVAGLLFKKATQGCIGTRVPRVAFRGTRIRRIRVFVNGHEDRRLTVRTLQRRVRPRVRLAPGTYRIAVRVLFQRGSGTPPLTLRGRARICGRAAQPRFTG